MTSEERRNQNQMRNQQERAERTRRRAERMNMVNEAKNEREAERGNEPMLKWIYKTFRVIAFGAAIILGAFEGYNALAAEAANLWERVFFVSWGAFTAFGLIWIGAAFLYMLSLKKDPDAKPKESTDCMKNIGAAIICIVILTALAFLI